MLHLETNEDGDRVFIYADEGGIERLKETLEILSQDHPEHDHLFTPAWGGSELDEELQENRRDQGSEKNNVVHEVKLYFWPATWKSESTGS